MAKQITSLLCPDCKKEYLQKEYWGKDGNDIKWRYSCNLCGFSEIRRKWFK